MILVVSRPNTNDIVKQNRTSLLSLNRFEYGEPNHAAQQNTYTSMGAHSRKTGRMGSPARLRARTTLTMQAGRCAEKNVTSKVGAQRSRNESSPKISW